MINRNLAFAGAFGAIYRRRSHAKTAKAQRKRRRGKRKNLPRRGIRSTTEYTEEKKSVVFG